MNSFFQFIGFKKIICPSPPFDAIQKIVRINFDSWDGLIVDQVYTVKTMFLSKSETFWFIQVLERSGSWPSYDFCDYQEEWRA